MRTYRLSNTIAQRYDITEVNIHNARIVEYTIVISNYKLPCHISLRLYHLVYFLDVCGGGVSIYISISYVFVNNSNLCKILVNLNEMGDRVDVVVVYYINTLQLSYNCL